MKTRIALLTAVTAFLTLFLLTPPAAADNCDIFISPADCQNTGWTIGVIATIAGGVAVAAAATTVSSGGEPEKPEPNPPPPVVPRPKRRDRDGSSPVDVRPIFDPPRIEAGPSGPEARHHSVALEVHWDHGRQTVREVPHDHT
ncbi:hypothetical protein DMA12_06250 [Amycolatopsis balhimycina DSM 5908]|uniref:Uncharacterized protein n=1 Tax=Amycolatopsis balhimycina DSM 5908 TaxID=1081091 RepID=A0A428X080_AMYBA|nr:hypothetical protein [Amycolatopsis balhimycina]RSM48719.1 hypothetical protein DMA12_06250 [Amycolatopsis balhimycina DSM 5908]